VSGYPHDPVVAVDDQRGPTALDAGHLAIDEKILQRLVADETQRTKSVTRAPESHRQPGDQIGIQHGRHRVGVRAGEIRGDKAAKTKL
jgi:hypothetical protein